MCLTQPIQVQLPRYRKIFSDFFLNFRTLHKILSTLGQEMSLRGYLFLKYRLEKTGLVKCLKSHVSEHLCTVNMLRGLKDCLNQHGSIFVVFFDQHGRKLTRKILS